MQTLLFRARMAAAPLPRVATPPVLVEKTWDEVQAAYAATPQGGNPFSKAPAPFELIAQLFKGFKDKAGGGAFSTSHDTVRAYSTGNLGLVFDSLGSDRTLARPHAEFLAAMLALFEQLATDAEDVATAASAQLCFLWFPHLAEPRSPGCRLVGKAPTEVWRTPDAMCFLVGVADKVKRNSQPAVRIVPVLPDYGLDADTLLRLVQTAAWSKATHKAVSNAVLRVLEGGGLLPKSILRRVHGTLLLAAIGASPASRLATHTHPRGPLCTVNVALGHESDSHTLFAYLFSCPGISTDLGLGCAQAELMGEATLASLVAQFEQASFLLTDKQKETLRARIGMP